MSCLHVSIVSQLPLQQSHEELHDIVFSLQTSPSGLQPIGLRQTPSVDGAVMTHVTGVPEPPGNPAEPQQSVSVVQRSPTTWQPLAGWQTSAPVGPHGAHARLQHGPPHAGSPASMLAPPQSWPSTTPQLAGPPGGAAPHVPSVEPAAIVHAPVQQSVPAEHASPPCPQNDEAWHVPFEQSAEQQSAPDAHWLPSVLQVAFSAAHAPPTQLWLQQSPFARHAPWSDVHAGYRQALPWQSALQQSAPVVHPAPSPRQLPAGLPVPPVPPKTLGESGEPVPPVSPDPELSGNAPVSPALVASRPGTPESFAPTEAPSPPQPAGHPPSTMSAITPANAANAPDARWWVFTRAHS